MYLVFYHGRNTPDEHMDDWGFPGPIVGPFVSIHIVYGFIHLCDEVGEYCDLIKANDTYPVSNKYYGDISIVENEELYDKTDKRVISLKQYATLTNQQIPSM